MNKEVLDGSYDPVFSERCRFWVTCPYCKRKYPVDGQMVEQYIDKALELAHDTESEADDMHKRSQSQNTEGA